MEEDDYIELSSFSMYIADSVRECAVKMSKPLITYSERTINIDKTIQSTHSYVRECAVKMSKAIDNYQYLLRANYKYWQNNTIQSTHSYQTSVY